MIRRKKEIKRIFFSALFIITICLANVQILNNFNTLQGGEVNNIVDENLLNDALKSSNSNLDDNITGFGVNQDVRIYANNVSENLLNNEGFFEIPSVASEDMFLTYGNFNFTFQNNFTTDYTIENNSALYAENFIEFGYDTGYFTMNFKNGSMTGDYTDLWDNNNGTSIELSSDPSGLLNFTMTANYTDTTYTSGVINGNVEFNRTKILALISSLVFTIQNSEDVNLTVRIKNYSDSTWKELISVLPINGSLGIQELKDHFINENLNFIDLNNVCEIEFVLERGDSFSTLFHEYKLQSVYAFDLPITNQSYVALEFDLKGKKSTVNGFYAWIRTLNLTAAASTQINISLYRANRTLIRSEVNLQNVDLGPKYNEMIDSIVVNTYIEDGLSYFEFNRANTTNLNLYNYFIIIKTNNPQEVYSLVTIPHFTYGDSETEHQLKITTNDGLNWRNAKKIITTTNLPYTSGQLDASSFKLNVTRGYMPSDFIVNNNQTLRIQDIPLEDLEDKSFPYNESSYLTWGIGQWKHNFSTIIEDDTFNNFRVDVNWNKTIIKGFMFNVSDYSVIGYWVENASATYSVYYDDNPNWLFKYDFNASSILFNNWDFVELWYVFQDYFIAYNVTNPDNEKILTYKPAQTILEGDPGKNKVVVDGSLLTLNGVYTLNLSSFNFIHDMNSYINYKGRLWESNGFMYGDNISMSLDIKDHKDNAPKSGEVNSILFYPNGSKFRELNWTNGYIDDNILRYDFNNRTILNLTNALTVFGEYHLGFFWFNGSAIGCKKIPIYIDTYDVVLYNCEYYPQIDTNVLDGEIKNKVFRNYTIFVASINETTGISIPNFYPINNTGIDTTYSRKIGDQDLPVLLSSFKQSENILNPNETVDISVSLQNLHTFLPVNVKIDVKLVSYINKDWIIAENTSNTISLNFSGHKNDNREFDVKLSIPDLDVSSNTWEGVNAPVRLGGVKTLITIYIDDFEAGEYESPDYSLLSNKTSNDFEGYILGLRVADETSSRSILYDFDREECIYYPKNSTFLVNIIDRNYVSSYHQFFDEFSLTLNSRFTDILITPNNPIKGTSFNLSSVLTTEFGEELSGKNVSCHYYEQNVWVDAGFDVTDSNGFTTFLINTELIDFTENLLLKLSWDGDTVNGVEKNVSVPVVHQINNLSISIISTKAQIIRNRAATFTINLLNIGNSDLKVTDITIEISQHFSYSLVEIDYLKLDWLTAGESTSFILEVQVGSTNNFEIEISITAQNVITNNSFNVTNDALYHTFDPPITDYFVEFFILIIGAIIVLVWLTAIIYSRRIKRKIETPIEEPVRKKPRREKYVPVSELKKPAPVKQITKKKETPKTDESEKVDLDSLLEQRGLADKKKKPKE
ncbi:MAG: hypothetical protein ACFFCV_03370 [Promethearchaeota archaeon]